MRVVCIAAECEPWAKTGGLGDVVDALARAVGAIGASRSGRAAVAPDADDDGSAAASEPAPNKPRLPQSQVWLGTGGVMGVGPGDDMPLADVQPPIDVFIPFYRGVVVPERATRRPLAVPDPLAAEGTTEVTLVEFDDRGYRVRLIDHPPAFDRDDFYGGPAGDFPDNGWRFGLLCRAAIEALLLDERPVDVLHLHDWQAMPTVVLRDVRLRGLPADLPRGGRWPRSTTSPTRAGCRGTRLPGLFFPDELAEAIQPKADGILLLGEGIGAPSW